MKIEIQHMEPGDRWYRFTADTWETVVAVWDAGTEDGPVTLVQVEGGRTTCHAHTEPAYIQDQRH
jgi:hypothetical protein